MTKLQYFKFPFKYCVNYQYFIFYLLNSFLFAKDKATEIELNI